MLRNKKFTSFSLIAIIYLASFAGFCNNNKDAQRAAVAAHDTQTVIDTTVDATTQLFHDNIIKKELAHNIGLALQKANAANQALINAALAMSKDTSANRCILANGLTNVALAVKELKDLGVLGIKSKEGNLIFDTAIASLIANIKIVAAIIGKCATSVPSIV